MEEAAAQFRLPGAAAAAAVGVRCLRGVEGAQGVRCRQEEEEVVAQLRCQLEVAAEGEVPHRLLRAEQRARLH